MLKFAFLILSFLQQSKYTYVKSGPVFLMISDRLENPKVPVFKMQEKKNALCFQFEHQFYDQSHPTEDLSIENLKYLSM